MDLLDYSSSRDYPRNIISLKGELLQIDDEEDEIKSNKSDIDDNIELSEDEDINVLPDPIKKPNFKDFPVKVKVPVIVKPQIPPIRNQPPPQPVQIPQAPPQPVQQPVQQPGQYKILDFYDGIIPAAPSNLKITGVISTLNDFDKARVHTPVLIIYILVVIP